MNPLWLLVPAMALSIACTVAIWLGAFWLAIGGGKKVLPFGVFKKVPGSIF